MFRILQIHLVNHDILALPYRRYVKSISIGSDSTVPVFTWYRSVLVSAVYVTAVVYK